MLAGDMYTEFYGLDDRPFSLLPDPESLFWTDQHRAAFTVLEYGVVSRAPITVLTGEIGTGKTTLLRYLLEIVDEETTIGLISNAQGGRGELIRWVLYSLGLKADPAADYVSLFQVLQEHLLDEYAAGRRVAIVIDEAQNLSVEALEELRMLTNINSGRDELVQLILVGQPELRGTIMRTDLQQFAQRVVATFHLAPLDADHVRSYVAHRLKLVGGTGNEFSYEALEEIAVQSSGIPRLVNKLAEFCLVYGATNEERPISAETVRQVVADGVFVRGFSQTGKAAE